MSSSNERMPSIPVPGEFCWWPWTGTNESPGSHLATLQRATALGQIDFSVVKGWVTPEEWLYPQIQEALTAWTLAHRPSHVIYRVVGEQWAPRSHELRDLLTRNGVPFEFYAADSETGLRLIDELRLTCSASLQ